MTGVKKMSLCLFLFVCLSCMINKTKNYNFFFVGTFLDPCHDNWSGVSTPLNFSKKKFFRSNRDKKILKVRKHCIAAVNAANMADIKIWCAPVQIRLKCLKPQKFNNNYLSIYGIEIKANKILKSIKNIIHKI